MALETANLQSRSVATPELQSNHEADRVIFSPNKPKNGGITAGIARVGTGKDSATGNGVDDSEEVRTVGFLQVGKGRGILG